MEPARASDRIEGTPCRRLSRRPVPGRRDVPRQPDPRPACVVRAGQTLLWQGMPRKRPGGGICTDMSPYACSGRDCRLRLASPALQRLESAVVARPGTARRLRTPDVMGTAGPVPAAGREGTVGCHRMSIMGGQMQQMVSGKRASCQATGQGLARVGPTTPKQFGMKHQTCPNGEGL